MPYNVKDFLNKDMSLFNFEVPYVKDLSPLIFRYDFNLYEIPVSSIHDRYSDYDL